MIAGSAYGKMEEARYALGNLLGSRTRIGGVHLVVLNMSNTVTTSMFTGAGRVLLEAAIKAMAEEEEGVEQ